MESQSAAGGGFSAILDTLCVGRRRAGDADEAVFLFVQMRPGAGPLTPALARRIRDAVRSGLSPRHVPRFVEEVKEIPVTINGKKVEIAVKKVISGQDVKLSATVANPGSLEEYRKFRDWDEEPKAKL